MKTIGFIISHTNQEKRRALLPRDLEAIRRRDQVFVEAGYGEALGIPDRDYERQGIRIVSRREALDQDVIVDVKLGNADYLDELTPGKILFGWAHAVQKTAFTTAAVRGRHSVYAWEELYEDGRYLFYRNREVAGEAAIMHGYTFCGRMPYETKVALIGNGQTARGALRILFALGADVDVFPRRLEKLFRKRMDSYDVIVNCVLWDLERSDRLIYRDDLKRLRPGAFLIDVSCNEGIEIETSFPTSIDDPVYAVDGVVHYAVENTPALFPHTVSRILSERLVSFFNDLIDGELTPPLRGACVIDNGQICSQAIIDYRSRRGLPLN